VPDAGSIARHQRFYYLELLLRAGLIAAVPDAPDSNWARDPRFRQAGEHRLPGCWIGVAPGAANGTAKQWRPERFAEAAVLAASALGAQVAVFGTRGELETCARVASAIASRGVRVTNFSGQTSAIDLVEMLAGCRALVANDSGAMHVSAALGVPTVAVFGPTDARATGPIGDHVRIVREPVPCSPCLLKACPIGHDCMNAITADRVAQELLDLVQPPRP